MGRFHRAVRGRRPRATRRHGHDAGPSGGYRTSGHSGTGIHQVTTLQRVVEHDRAELLALHGFGPSALRILEDALAERGLTLQARPSRVGSAPRIDAAATLVEEPLPEVWRRAPISHGGDPCGTRPVGQVMGVMALGCWVPGRSGRSEPGRKCSRQLWVREVSSPGDMPVGSDQHGGGGRDLPDHRKFPHAIVSGVDQPDSTCPGSPASFVVLTFVWASLNTYVMYLAPAARVWLFVVAALAFVSLVLFELGKLWRVGIYGADLDIATGIDYQRSLQLSTNRLDFLGTGAAKLTSLPEFEQAVNRCHRDDRPVRMLLLDPTGGQDFLSSAARRAGHDRDEYARRVRDSLGRIADLVCDRSINIEVRFYSTPQPFRLVFVNDRLCLFGYNVYGEGEEFHYPQLHVVRLSGKRDVDSFYYSLMRYFERLWEQSDPWTVSEWSS